ncbi:SusC/RagA family TonB-linked outer membrane protein [Galbibacter mesophilus]|uniref:SusC/RagA family TonB-linked outer membrane protein n=1 Tax=Galbibacter mesophilus TaxID=379069 RepID=UPI00192005C6|nr:TonB-dependent receptor [Galbibacter mesophilus]MCM5664069.1 TonB-dependent receptor [Galbibacter mesophilus]
MKLTLTTFLMFFLYGAFAQSTITGTVSDNLGQPLPGVNVVVKGTSQGVSTDFDGNFSIQASPKDVLEFTYLGFQAQEVLVGNQSQINVQLKEDSQQLDEVVVIGYGTSTKKDLVSSVASVKSDVLENQPVARLDQALQGRAAGVEVTSNNGAPGAASTIRIRGASSIQGNNNPLYVVDGFIAGTNFNLNNLNVNDIESVEVLKDATALAIYGTRGAAGVILITTKSGTKLPPGKPTISINQYASTQNIANEINILRGQGYIDYVNEAGQFVPGPGVDVNGVNVPIGMTDPSLPLQYDEGESPDTDWLGLVEQLGTINNTDLSVTGRGENTNYYISMNYFNQKGILKGSGLERVSFRNNLDVKISDRLKTGVRLNLARFRRENNKVAFGNIISQVLPVRAVYDEEGDYTGTDPISGNAQRNPVADIELREDHDLVTNFVSNAYLEYELFKDFTLKTTFGAELNYFKNNFYISAFAPERLANSANGGLASVDQNQSQSLLNENTFTYDKELGKHSLKFLGGFTWQKSTSQGSSAEAQGFPNDAVKFNSLQTGSDATTYQISSGYSQRTLVSFLGRVTYGFDDRYILTLVGRKDGSSVFEEGNKYAFFPSIGGAWNVDQESFMGNVEAVNALKFRASYGVIGEEGVAPYNSFDVFNPQNNYFNENLVGAVILDRPGSDGLKWETTKQLDIGFELGMFQNRVIFEADYYNKTTEDLLLFSDLPNTAGSRQLKNVGSIENKGFEFSLTTVNIRSKDFSWETSLNLTTNKSKVLDLGGEPFINIQSTGSQGGPSARLIVGEAVPVFIGAKYLGTYKTAEEILEDDRVGQSFIGSPRFEDLDGNGTINQEDYQVLGSPQPDFYGGFRNTFRYKGINLDIFFQGQYGSEIFNVLSQTSFYGRGDQNLDPIVLDRWQEGVNETSDIPRAGTSTSLFNPNSTVNIEDGSFLRLKQVSLGYDIPVEKAGIDHIFKRLNVYMSGNNLLLFSDFRLGDPEVNNFTAGSGFGSVSQGFASGQYPYATTITAGIKMDF